MNATTSHTSRDSFDLWRGQAELSIVASKEYFATACRDSQVGSLNRGEIVRCEGKLGEIDGGDGGLL